MAISNKMSILGTKKAVAAYNGGYYLPSVSDEGILSWSPTVEGMAPIPEVNVRGPQGSDASVTAEAVQAVVPIAFGKSAIPAYVQGSSTEAVAIGTSSSAYYDGISIGAYSAAATPKSISIGAHANDTGECSISIGRTAKARDKYSICLGLAPISNKSTTITIGSQFTEVVNGQNVTNYCTTEGTGSITIGAGANTLNNGDTESSNSVTIGCKASNSSADAVVIGADANNNSISLNGVASCAIGAGATVTARSVAVGRSAIAQNNGVSIGNEAKSIDWDVCIGSGAISDSFFTVGIGARAYTKKERAVAVGCSAQALDYSAIAIGSQATAADRGATVIRSTAEDGTYTQLYFSGANTPLANKYFPTAWEQKQDVDPETNEPLFDENGDPVMVDDKDKPIAGDAMMGFVTVKNGEIIARGANMLSALFPYYTGDDENPFAPTTMSLRPGDEPQEVMVFRPSDLDLPAEEPEETEEPEVGESEPAKYIPLPVYPIVEPEIPEVEEV